MSTTEQTPLISANGVTVRFDGHEVLTGVDVAIRTGEIVALIGPNGSGKTTLVRVLLGLLPCTAGMIERAPGLRIGYVPQHHPVDAILPLTVSRFLTLSARARPDRLHELLEEVGAPTLFDAPVHQLSGGELRRVLIARALLRDPGLLVLDEPTAGVDFSGQIALFDLISRIRDRRGCGVLTVSHELHLVMSGTDRVVCLNHHVCCHGQPDAVSRHPAYIEIFGPQAAGLAVYTHEHDHEHTLDGGVVSADEADNDGPNVP